MRWYIESKSWYPVLIQRTIGVAYGIGIKTLPPVGWRPKNQLTYGIEKVGQILGPVTPHYFPTYLRDLLAEFSWIAVD